jgi:hypothetical protein
MGWNINTFDNKYQIKYGSNSSYLITSNDVSYLTITNDKHIGINNEFPSSKYLLDINGITHINSNIYIDGYSYISSNIYIKDNIYVDNNIYVEKNIITSNIIGGYYHNSNIIKLNNTSYNNYSNNIVEIYGKTSLFGKVYINTDDKTNPPINTPHLLVIDGSLKADRIYGDGANINNINANNISSGKIPVILGGTGLNTVEPNQILFGTVQTNSSGNLVYSISQSPNLIFDGNKLICKMSTDVLFDGIIRVERGGTGRSSFNRGLVLYGNDNINILTSESFKFEDNTLKIANLELENSIIKIKTNTNALRNLNASDIGILNATYTTPGLIKVQESDFRIDDGLLSLKQQANTWASIGNTADNKIHYPSLLKIRGNELSYVGINTTDPKYTLDVNGTINSSYMINSSNINSSNYTINGINLETSLLNKLIIESRITSENFIKGINLITSNILTEEQSILIKSTSAKSYNRVDNEDIWKINKALPNIFESPKINITNLCRTNSLEIYNDYTGGGIDNNNIDIFNIHTTNEGITNKLLKFTKAGNLFIGNDLGSSVPPERLTIKGNISASGHIRSYYSDSRLKTLTSNITGALDIIDSLNGFYYVPNEKALELGFEYDNEIGLSAQDVKKVIPEIVKMAPFDTSKNNKNIGSKSGENYLTICYERLGAVFVESIKELRKENIALKSEINVLKKDIENIKKIIYIQ